VPGLRLDASLAARLYDRSGAGRWGLPRDQFAAAVEASVAHAFGDRRPDAAEVARYADALHLEDLALAAACAAGLAPAWEHFIAEHRPGLRRAADAIDPTGNARELADSLYADLYGLAGSSDTRRSLFRYFHGRSRLGTWLRAVLSQRHIDRIRAARRTEPLPDHPETIGAIAVEAASPERARFQAVMEAACASAIAALDPRDRLRLSCYYVQQLKLAAIGRLLGEHEATVSRHLTRTRALIRDAVEARLRADHAMNDEAIAECFQVVVQDAGTLDLGALLGSGPERKDPAPDRSQRKR